MSPPSASVSALAGRTILVTGATGFIASAIVKRLAPIDGTIRRMIRNPASAPSGRANVQDVIGDVRDRETWAAALPGADVVIHLAAETSAAAAEADPASSLATNVDALRHAIAIAATLDRPPTIVAAGTATQVGLTDSTTPVCEDQSDRPATVYDTHKCMAEHLLERASADGIVRATTLRLTNVYGPGPAGSRHDRGWLTASIRRAMAGEALTVFGIGDAVRDYVYVDDVAEAFFAAACGVDALSGKHFLIGTGTGTSLRDALLLVSEHVARRTGRRVAVTSVEAPASLSPIERRRFVADSRRFQDATGWRPAVTLNAGIERTIASVQR